MTSGIWHLEPRQVRRWYEHAVAASFHQPGIRAYLDLQRPQVTRERLREAFDHPRIITEVLRASTTYSGVRQRAARADALRGQLAQARDRCRMTLFLPLILVVLLSWWVADVGVGLPWWVGVGALVTVAGYGGVRELRDAGGRNNLLAQVQTAALFMAQAVRAFDAEMRLMRWATRRLGLVIAPVMQREMTRLLGPDYESLFVARSHEGLIDAGNARYWISTRAEAALQQKLDQMSGGAIAICGPRGVGKSTLLKKACQGILKGHPDRHFHVIVQTPANYRPEEFLLSLFQSVCRNYLALYGRQPRAPFLFRSRARTAHWPRRLYWSSRRWVQLLAGAGLVVLAIQDRVRDLADGAYRSARPAVSGWGADAWEWAVTTCHDYPLLTHGVLGAMGVALMWRADVKSWHSGRPVRRLVRDCHNYLDLLQRIQTVGTSTSLGASGGGLTLGIGRNRGSTSRNFTYPELVWEFRTLLTRISAAEQQDNWKVFIGIDELDRLGSTEQARGFLAEIKAIFDVPRVYFILSVSEDVGAAFIRRGLPARDIIDSSLEDVMVIEPRTLPESRVLLQTRVPGFTDPFVALVHALSGGIPRDLIRYTRKVTEIHRRTGEPALAALARELLWEEAAQALSGFRVLLAHQEGSARSAQTVHDLHTLVSLIRSADPTRANPEVEQRIIHLAHMAHHPPHADSADPADELGQRWEEFSCHLHFIGTLLEVFARRNYAARKAAYTGPTKPHGDLQRLAEARLEMTVSPHSARKILEQFRTHWALRPAIIPPATQLPAPPVSGLRPDTHVTVPGSRTL
ncbi:P-loop NTPase fold protein [Streptomyces sp. NPDC054835]